MLQKRQRFRNKKRVQPIAPAAAVFDNLLFVKGTAHVFQKIGAKLRPSATDMPAQSLFIDVESFGQGFLVMSVTPHKYWRITLDGRPVGAVITNIGYQGIPVPAGRHRVEMTYRNPLAAGGAKVSVAATALLLAAALLPRRRSPA